MSQRIPMIDRFRQQLPTLTELRAIFLNARRPLPTDHLLRVAHRSDTGSDQQLLKIMGEPFESVSDVRERLGEAETYLRERSDRRSVFLTVYTEMTTNVEAGIDSGTFDDPDWVRDYLVAFADRYRIALVASERGNSADVPMAWRLAFDASTSGYTILIQDAFLGMSAHINHDLPYTLQDVGVDPDRASKRRDHDRINEILRQLIDVVQRALSDVYDADRYTDVDSLFGSFDEDFTLIGLTEARSLAWRNAILLTDMQSALVRRFVNWRVRTVATGASYFILAPSADPSVIWALRQIEQDSPPIDHLRDAFQRRLQQQEIGIGGRR